jgi:cytochrome c
MDFNKIFAAVLSAGVVAMIAIIASGMLVQPAELKTPAYPIEGVAETAPAPEEAPSAEVAPVAPLLASADVDKGAQIAKQCKACHNFAKGGPNAVGPNLWGVLGGPHAHKADFNYSDAMKGQKGDWTYEALNTFIAHPQLTIPGTKMGFAGLKKPDDRADVIAWLREQSDNPLPLPAAAAPAAAPAPAK